MSARRRLCQCQFKSAVPRVSSGFVCHVSLISINTMAEQWSAIHQLLRETQDSQTSLLTALKLELAKTQAEKSKFQRELVGASALAEELAKSLNQSEERNEVLLKEKEVAENKLLQTEKELVAKDNIIAQMRRKPMMHYKRVLQIHKMMGRALQQVPRHQESPPRVKTRIGLPKKIDATKPGAAGEEGVLGNFFNSLLSKKAGNNNPASPARPGEQPNNIPPVDKAGVQ